jgi:hypothetical protein
MDSVVDDDLADPLPPADGGWFELKTVNGYGPYLYYRWRDGKTCRSRYLGKADQETVAWVEAQKRKGRST